MRRDRRPEQVQSFLTAIEAKTRLSLHADGTWSFTPLDPTPRRCNEIRICAIPLLPVYGGVIVEIVSSMLDLCVPQVRALMRALAREDDRGAPRRQAQDPHASMCVHFRKMDLCRERCESMFRN